jgi:hypothetical protein
VSIHSLSSPGDAADLNESAEVGDSPTRLRQDRRQKLKRRTSVDSVITKVGSLTLERNDGASGKHRKLLDDEPMRNISLQPETAHQASSKDVYTDIQMTNVNDHDASDELELHVETNGQDVAEDAPRFPTKDTSTSDESDQEAVTLAPSPAEQSDAEACSNAAPGKQSTNRNANPSTVSNYIQSASRPRPRVWISSESIRANEANDSSSLGHGALSPKPRGQKPSPPIVLSPEVEVHNVDPVEESYASLMPSPSSSHEVQEEEPTTVTTGAFGPSVIDETATPIQDPETIGSMQDVSRVVGPRIERFHGHEKDTSGVKIMILETLRNKKRETQITKNPIKGHKKRETQTTKSPLKGLFYTSAYPKWWHRGYSSLDCDPSDGYIYMFTTDKYKGHVKIGSTKKMPEDRVEEWTYRCKTTGEYIPDPNIKPFRHYRIVESIVHAALYNERRKIACGECNRLHLFSPEGDKKMHGEWFEVPEDRALKIIEKWRTAGSLSMNHTLAKAFFAISGY